jgi:hypothetical protein
MNYIDFRIKGKSFRLPCATINGRVTVCLGRWLKIASLHDEDLVEGALVPDVPDFISKLKVSGLKADVFMFAQRLYESKPVHPYFYESDNAAVASTEIYADWWEKRIPQETRKNVRRAAKRGVSVRVAAFDDGFVKGIKAIYDETPVRQGMRFWHFGKDFQTVKMENATYLERSEFIGAYLGEELIGFIKLVYVDQTAQILQILAKSVHQDKRPIYALVAKAVEICQTKGMKYLVYSKFSFGNKKDSPLAEFKRRNGFERMEYPRYYLPLTLKGRIAIVFRLHHGLLGILPSWLIHWLLRWRADFLNLIQKLTARRGGVSQWKQAQTTENS